MGEGNQLSAEIIAVDKKVEENLENCQIDDANDKNEEQSENEDEENVQIK